eukprot:6201662-Pleurochrysis_carterae.AAC.3
MLTSICCGGPKLVCRRRYATFAQACLVPQHAYRGQGKLKGWVQFALAPCRVRHSSACVRSRRRALVVRRARTDSTGEALPCRRGAAQCSRPAQRDQLIQRHRT